MKFAHIADCHIGSWRDPKLLELSTRAFEKAVDECIKRDVKFILISGDLFNTALPGITQLKDVVVKLKELWENQIPVYIIQGSHDFSPSGKTMIDVLESAALVKNVVKGEVKNNKLRLKFTKDLTGAKITGMLGKKGSLERTYYEDLDREHLESEQGFKIFMFHTALTELKSEELSKMESSPVSLLPKGFDYYAAGHVHEVIEEDMEGYGKIVYPGPLFPNNFREVEKLKHGGFYIYNEGSLEYVPMKLFSVKSFSIDCNDLSAEQARAKAEEALTDVENMIVTLRLHGRLSSGRASEIGIGEIADKFYEKGAYFVMKNTSALTAKDFEEVKVREDSIENIENQLVQEHAGNFLEKDKEAQLIHEFMRAFSQEIVEGERKADYEDRIKDSAKRILEEHKILE
ncbi:MAG: DNA repair exonuclease [Nanoarchaeota archaeon]